MTPPEQNHDAGAPNGVLVVDKPSGMTSHDVVDRVRRVAATRRVGHTGTLDPLATGVLVVCVGRATRIAQFLTGLDKEYTGTIKLGAISSTYDAEGSIVASGEPLPSGAEEIETAMREQEGLRFQLAPPYSAVKVRGKKLYEYARQGKEVPQKSRRVQIHRFRIDDYCEPELKFRSRVGSGTYIRAMAHELGVRLGCGAYLSSLKRTRVGSFGLENAVDLETLINHPEVFDGVVLDIAQALAHFPKIIVARSAEDAVLHGRSFTTRDIIDCDTLPRLAEQSVVLGGDGRVLSIVRAEAADQEGEADERENESDADWSDRSMCFRPVRVLGQE